MEEEGVEDAECSMGRGGGRRRKRGVKKRTDKDGGWREAMCAHYTWRLRKKKKLSVRNVTDPPASACSSVFILASVGWFVCLPQIMDLASVTKIALYAAIIVLIVVMGFLGVSLRNAKDVEVERVYADCPDYWKIDASGNCAAQADPTKARSYLNTGTLDAGEFIKSFQDEVFKGSNGLCQKRKWALASEVQWDGLTYGSTLKC